MVASVSFRATDNGRNIEVRRDGDVPDDFWRKVRAEWGQAGADPSVAVVVPIERFALRNSWLPSTCRQFGVAVRLDDAVRAVATRAQRDRENLRLARTRTEQVPVDVDDRLSGSRFVRELTWFQTRDVGVLLQLDHGANFSVPGAGKTTVELAVYEAERMAGRVDRMLVVAPLSAFDAWVQDSAHCLQPSPVLHRYAGGHVPPNVEILVVNYQRLTLSYEYLSSWVVQGRALVVLDEAHRMKKGRDGEWGAACLDLAFVASRRDVLTGTPAPQHPSDLIAILDFLWPGEAVRVLPSAALVPVPAESAVKAVTDAIRPLFVRTTKHQLALPDTVKRVVTVPLDGLHRQIYDALRSRFSAIHATQRDRVDLAAWGDVIMYLLEAATNPALLPAGSSRDDPIRFKHPPLPIPPDSSLRDLIADYAEYETPAKFVQVAALVRETADAGRKILIWSNFVRNLQILERMLSVYAPALVHGGIPSEITQPLAPRRREDEIERFRTDPACQVLLANPAALGEGVSLHQVCHDALYLERTFNAGQYLQSVDRIHRLGLDPGVETRITFLVTADTIDETVAARIQRKASNLGIMLDDESIATMSLPDEDDVGAPLDVGDDGDIEALFAHLRSGDM